MSLVKLAGEWSGFQNAEKYYTDEDKIEHDKALNNLEKAKTEKIPFLKSRKEHVKQSQENYNNIYNKLFYKHAIGRAKVLVNNKWVKYNGTNY